MMLIFRKIAIAGLVAASLTSLTASTETAAALPVARPGAPDADGGLPTAVQYYYGYRPYYRPYGYYRPYRYDRGRAGLYGCGPYAFHTHLSRKACR